jgi:hypothetical protein
MKRYTPVLLAGLAMLSLTACVDGVPKTETQPRDPNVLLGPPPGYTKEQWLSPNGCTYIRAHAPGYTPTWHLVVNGAKIGGTNAKRSCEVVIEEGT